MKEIMMTYKLLALSIIMTLSLRGSETGQLPDEQILQIFQSHDLNTLYNLEKLAEENIVNLEDLKDMSNIFTLAVLLYPFLNIKEDKSDPFYKIMPMMYSALMLTMFAITSSYLIQRERKGQNACEYIRKNRPYFDKILHELMEKHNSISEFHEIDELAEKAKKIARLASGLEHKMAITMPESSDPEL